jgi:hypothetical protein
LTGREKLIKILAELLDLKLSRFNNEGNIVKYWSFNAVGLVLYMSLISGCGSHISLEDLTRTWIGRPLSELKQEMKSPDSYSSKIGWKETTYPLANGDFVYVEPVSADCSVHWEISQSGTIIGYQAKGNGCKEGGPADSISNKTQSTGF